MMVEGADALVARSTVLTARENVGTACGTKWQLLSIFVLELHIRILQAHMRVGRVFAGRLHARQNQDPNTDGKAGGDGELHGRRSNERNGKHAEADDI
jgi:hypothetical protein